MDAPQVIQITIYFLFMYAHLGTFSEKLLAFADTPMHIVQSGMHLSSELKSKLRKSRIPLSGPAKLAGFRGEGSILQDRLLRSWAGV